MIPIYETERFRREANRCGLDGFADDLRERFERDPDPNIHFDCSLPMRTWYTIKKRRGHIVGRLRTVRFGVDRGSTQEVFCLLRVIGFDDPDRSYIIGHQARENVRSLPEGIDEQDLQAYVEKWLVERHKSGLAYDPELPAVPDEYKKWLQPPQWFAAGELDPLELVVFETKAWRQHMPTIEDHWAEIHTALMPFLFDDPQGEVYLPDCPGLRVVETKEKIVILCIYRGSKGVSQRRLLMLIDALDENKPENISRQQWLTSKQEIFLSLQPATESAESSFIDLYGRRAIRAYPGLYLDREAYEAWKLIEKEESANLAMSPEEESLLTGLTRAASQEGSMPAFINGRAGSGKSTVLYYLFAHYWMFGKRLGAMLPGRPVFLTLSGRLLNTARETVKSIVEADCRYQPESQRNPAVMDGLEQAFRPFRSMLLEILPPLQRFRYSRDREIDFEVFRRLLLHEKDTRYPEKIRFKGRLDRWCTPELCWHVIRSYIKGFSPRGLMDVGSYRMLPETDCSVEDRHFDWVFEKVWPWYRGLTEGGIYWDQLDLAREVLAGLSEGTLELPEDLRDCVAVFCDEAQDLTGVELSLVLRLSFFSHHDLRTAYPLRNIPFAFAGDPLQTLNPTGFRWENLTSSFYRNLLEPLHLHRPLDKSELHFNYRSPRLITRLANLVQFHRRAVFHDNYLKPQRPWSLDDGVPPTRFEIPSTLTENEMIGLQDSFILLPCAEGHENEFAERFPLLQRLRNQPNPPELISVMAAKGLDLKKVVVFAFGEILFPGGVPDVKEDEGGHVHHIGLAYAFNQLYVAITRSTDELLIMDTKLGHKMLWDQLFDEDRIQRILDPMDKSMADAWREVLPEGNLPLWNSAVQFAPLTVEDLRAQADSLRSSGKDLQRADFMEKAAAFYRKAGRRDEEQECKAYAHCYAGRYHEASEEFRALKMSREAAECLWQGMVWRELVAMGDEVDPKRVTLARFMISNQTPFERLRSLLDDADRYGLDPEAPTIPQWRETVARLTLLASDLFRTPGGTDLMDGFYIRLAKFVRDLGKLGHPNCLELAADGFAKAKEWASARQLLDSIAPMGKVESRDLIMGHTAEWPNYIRPCNRAKMYELLLERWRKDGKPVKGMSQEEAGFLFDALWEQSETREAFRVAFAGDLFRKLKEIYDQLSLDNLLKTVTLCVLKDRSAFPLDKAVGDIWMRRADLGPEQRLEFVEVLCTVERWDRVSEIAQEILDGQPRPVDLNWICDAVAAHPVVRHAEFKTRDTIGETILALARKIGVKWPDGEVDLLRAVAALECIGLDKHITALGRMYGESCSDPVRKLSQQIYQRGRALYHERLGTGTLDRLAAEKETRDQLGRWGLESGPEKGEPFHPPERVALGATQNPFEQCSTVVREMEGFWITECLPYCIQVPKDKGGRPVGTVEISRREGRRPKMLFLDATTGVVELSDGTEMNISSGQVEDPDIGGSIELKRSGSTSHVTVHLPPWPEGVAIVLPAR